MVIAGILAGTGVYSMAEYIIQRLVDDTLIQAVWVLTPNGKYRKPGNSSSSRKYSISITGSVKTAIIKQALIENR